MGHFAVIIASEVLIVPAGQMGCFGESPAQIAIAVFTVAMSFALAVRKAIGGYTAGGV